MRYSLISLSFAILASASSVVAQPLGFHGHHAHKRDPEAAPEPVVVTVQETNYIYINADGSIASPTAAAVQAVSSVKNDDSSNESDAALLADSPGQSVWSSSSSPSPVTTATPTTTSSSSSSTSSTSSTSSPSSSSSSAASSSPSVDASTGGSGFKGITYSPYSTSGCKSADQVKSDLALLTGYDIIRIYGVDCNQVENVLNAISSGQKVFAGIYYVDQLQSGLQAIASALKSTGKSWDVIDTISIGNELLLNGYSASQVVDLVNSGRSYARSLGYTGPVVAVEMHVSFLEYPEVGECSDYIAANAHPFFDGNVYPQDSGSWLVERASLIAAKISGKTIRITETGWPTQGDAYGVGVPSTSNQQSCLSSIKSCSLAGQTIVFTAFNDLWKAPGTLNVEQYWGVIN